MNAFSADSQAAENESEKNSKMPNSSNAKGIEPCIASETRHPICKGAVFKRKTPTQQNYLIAENLLKWNEKHAIRNFTNARICPKNGYSSWHNTRWHGVDRLPAKRSKRTTNGKATECKAW